MGARVVLSFILDMPYAHHTFKMHFQTYMSVASVSGGSCLPPGNIGAPRVPEAFELHGENRLFKSSWFDLKP